MSSVEPALPAGAATLTVVVPAHDEEHLLPRLLASLREGVADGGLRVVVVANACTDATARVARDGGAEVVEIGTGSKIAALNAGIEAVRGDPVVAFVDADVTVTGRDLLTLAERLAADPDRHVAGLRLVVDAASSSWPVRASMQQWELTSYRSSALVGSGVYLLDAEGLARLGELPPVIADDLYVQTFFPPAARLFAADLSFTVAAPRTWRALLARQTRIRAGNAQLDELRPDLTANRAAGSVGTLARHVLRRPSLAPSFVVYAATYLLARRRGVALARAGGPIEWNRDATTRATGGTRSATTGAGAA